MKLEQVLFPEAGVCRLVFLGEEAELSAALAAEQAEQPSAEPQTEEERQDRLAAAINRAILTGISPLYEQAVAEHHLMPVTDPDFSLLAVEEGRGFRAMAEFFVAPPLTLGRCVGFEQAVRPRPIRLLTLEMEINRTRNAAYIAADEAGKAAIRRQVAAAIYEKRCQQATRLAEQELVYQLGAEVKGPLPKELVAGNYFAERRRFNLSMQARGVNFDQYLAVRGQTVEEFRQELHAQAEQRLRSRLGLLLMADRLAFWPTEAELAQAMQGWDNKRDGEPTFPANDRRKQRQKLATGRAAAYLIAHSTLLPPPEEPVIEAAPKG